MPLITSLLAFFPPRGSGTRLFPHDGDVMASLGEGELENLLIRVSTTHARRDQSNARSN
jgi:hypothetical protein